MSTINTLDFESKLTDELDKAVVQKSVTAFMADNSFRQHFVGARTVLIPDVDFSGLGNNERWKSENLSIDELIDDRLSNLYVNDNNEISLPPGIIKYFQEIKECMNISDSDFGKKVYDEFAKVNTPLQIFSQQECANILLAEIGVETRKLNNSYMVAKQRLQQLKNIN